MTTTRELLLEAPDAPDLLDAGVWPPRECRLSLTNDEARAVVTVAGGGLDGVDAIASRLGSVSKPRS